MLPTMTQYLAMLTGMDMFQEKVNSKSFCIVEIARTKNGFFEYKHSAASYTDIKFNVIIKGRKYSIIGEVQFLFKRMYEYKKIAHSLYSIERRREFVDDLNELLPIKLDLKKQLFIHAARNNVDGITGNVYSPLFSSHTPSPQRFFYFVNI